MSLSRAGLASAGGTALAAGQLQQLQWLLPTAFHVELQALLKDEALAGAKLRFTHEGVEHWWGVFDAKCLLDELLRRPANGALAHDALLPIAVCGQQRMTLYSVHVCDLSVWQSEDNAEPTALGLTLAQVVALAVAEPRVRARRRLPVKARAARSANARSAEPKQRASRRARVAAPCARTLPLFG